MTPTGTRPRRKSIRRERRNANGSRTGNSDRHWAFRKAGHVAVLQSTALGKQKWLAHGFSTRCGGASSLPDSAATRKQSGGILNLGFSDWDNRANVEENRRRFAKAFGAAEMKMVALRQFHSDVIHVIDSVPGDSLRGDALVTRTPGLLLAVQTADCIPILLADRENRIVAAIHAGWRGTLKRIAEKTVGRMRMLFGSRPEGIIAALGPGIGRCCYEVGPEVVKEFGSQFDAARDWFDGPYDALVSGEDPNPLPWLSMMPPGHQPPEPRASLDLHAANRAILEGAGVLARNISASELCTS
ncbi:MAG: peptidoglycan editing factor PgeF, partial [Candidatus Acidiferrales bacterium]